jgi:hypothetical protein
VLLATEAAAIYELPALDVQEREVIAVRLDEPVPAQLHGRHLDRPQPGTVTTGAVLELIGWALARRGRVTEIQVTCEDEILARTTVGVARPDLEAAFPDLPGALMAGFRTLVDLAAAAPDAVLHVRAQMDGEGCIPLGTIAIAGTIPSSATR